MQNDAIYAFELVNIPTEVASEVDVNVRKAEEAIALEATIDSLAIHVQSQEAEGVLDVLQEKNIFQAHFKTSKYSSFVQKVNALTINTGWSFPIVTGVHELGVNVKGVEMFDNAEINAHGGSQSLVQFEAVLTNPWYTNDIAPLIYSGYSSSGLKITWRTDISQYGVPPSKAVNILQEKDDRSLSDTEVEANVALAPETESIFQYNLPYIIYQDYINLATQASNSKELHTNSYLKKLALGPYPSVRSGSYPMELRYALPGTGTITSRKTININVQ